MDETPQSPSNNAPPPPPPSAPPPPSGPAGPSTGGVSDNRNIMIVLSYLGLLALIPLLVEKEDSEVQWHAKHGLVILVAFVALSFATVILSWIPGVGCITGLLWIALCFAMFIVTILCIVKGLNGQRFMIPGLSEFADRF